MKTIDHIPKTKISRATEIVKTGAKVGVNYLRYFGDKITKGEEEAREKLNAQNAEDIYESFSNLKGSTLKVAQMLSMEKGILPEQYVEKFSLAQFSVPPLSIPLVRKTFRKYFGKNPEELFDRFNPISVNAASIGQVHEAEKNGTKLAVKIQYPGVADSIASDLALVKPIAMRMFNIKGKDSEVYFNEVEEKLLEETNYLLEIAQSKTVKERCSFIPHLKFPRYYDELSCERIITMDWMDGLHISEYTQQDTDPEERIKIGQTLWDFYMFQIHNLKKVHADPHPGNFLVTRTGDLVALDFGCMKEIPNEFYNPYFDLLRDDILNNENSFLEKMKELEIIREDDTPEEVTFFMAMFRRMIGLFTQPFKHANFDFSDDTFFSEIYEMGEELAKDSSLRKMNANRGSRHFIYMNRTFYGLYNLLHDLKAQDIKIYNYQQWEKA